MESIFIFRYHIKMKICLFFMFFFILGNTSLNAKTITIAAYNFPPYNYEDATGNFKGVDTEITLAVLKKMGYQVKLISRPFNRAQFEMKSGSVAAILPCVHDKDRSQYIQFSQIPTATLDRRFYKLKSRNISWKSYDDIKGLKVGAADYSYGGGFKEAGKKGVFTIDTAYSTSPDLQNFKRLIYKRIDLLVVDRSVANFIIKKNAPKFDDVVIASYRTVGKIVPFSFGISKKYWINKKNEAINFMNLYEKTLTQFIKDGEREIIFKKYGFSPLKNSKGHLIYHDE